jgi:hypothetical protein
MPLHVTIADVQAWLDEDKIDLAENDPLPEEQHVVNMVFSRVGQIFNTSTWVDPDSTPDLLRTIISGLVAARRYNKIYSESDDASGNAYANKLEKTLDVLIEQVVDGTIQLIDVEGGASPAQVSGNNPTYWPTDQTGALEVFDASGQVVQPAGSQDIVFRMGQQF